MHVRFEFFSKQICNVEALNCHFYKNIKLSRKFISLGTLIYYVHALFFLPALQGVAPNAEGFSVVRPYQYHGPCSMAGVLDHGSQQHVQK